MTDDINENDPKRELRLFVFLNVILCPLLSIVIVGGIGFTIWMSNLLFGPPTY